MGGRGRSGRRGEGGEFQRQKNAQTFLLSPFRFLILRYTVKGGFLPWLNFRKRSALSAHALPPSGACMCSPPPLGRARRESHRPLDHFFYPWPCRAFPSLPQPVCLFASLFNSFITLDRQWELLERSREIPVVWHRDVMPSLLLYVGSRCDAVSSASLLLPHPCTVDDVCVGLASWETSRPIDDGQLSYRAM